MKKFWSLVFETFWSWYLFFSLPMNAYFVKNSARDFYLLIFNISIHYDCLIYKLIHYYFFFQLGYFFLLPDSGIPCNIGMVMLV